MVLELKQDYKFSTINKGGHMTEGCNPVSGKAIVLTKELTLDDIPFARLPVIDYSMGSHKGYFHLDIEEDLTDFMLDEVDLEQARTKYGHLSMGSC